MSANSCAVEHFYSCSVSLIPSDEPPTHWLISDTDIQEVFIKFKCDLSRSNPILVQFNALPITRWPCISHPRTPFETLNAVNVPRVTISQSLSLIINRS